MMVFSILPVGTMYASNTVTFTSSTVSTINTIAFVSDMSDSFQVYLMHLDQPIGKSELLQYLASRQ